MLNRRSIVPLLLGLLLCVPHVSHADSAPDFQLRSIDNQAVRLSDHRGKVVLLDFWATWCGPCKVAMPHIQTLHEELTGQGLVVLSVNVDEARTTARVRSYIRSKRYTFTVVLDRETEVITLYNPQQILPYVVLIDREGQIAWRHVGYVAGDEKELAERIRNLLASSE